MELMLLSSLLVLLLSSDSTYQLDALRRCHQLFLHSELRKSCEAQCGPEPTCPAAGQFIVQSASREVLQLFAKYYRRACRQQL